MHESHLMRPGAVRELTDGEWGAVSPGLARALVEAGARPRILARVCLPARLAQIRFGGAPIMVLGERVHWKGAHRDFSQPGLEHLMAVLQHELQHVLEFATGELSALRYVLSPRNWGYGYEITSGAKWRDFGAEQRAMIAQHLWMAERGLPTPYPPDTLRPLVPWAG
jgi:hypothetical protein